MGKVTGFLEYERVEEGYAPVTTRVKDYKRALVQARDRAAAKAVAAE